MSSPIAKVNIQSWRPQVLDSPVLKLAEAIRQGFAARALPLPVLAAQTHFSLHQSMLSPQHWAAIRQALGDEQRLLLADEGDLAAYPACRSLWGLEHFAIGGQLQTQQEPIVFLVPDASAYVHLSQLFSRQHNEPDFLAQWYADKISPPNCHGLIALVQDLRWLEHLREAGAEVYWRCDVDYVDLPPGVAAVAMPICSFMQGDDRSLLPVLHALKSNTRVKDYAQTYNAAYGHPLEALLRMPNNYADKAQVLERGRELLARCYYHPPCDIHLPPSDEADPDQRLALLCEEGVLRRYGKRPAPQVYERLAFELNIVREKQFASYILTVYDLAQQRRTCGRGSAASSIICYSLGLTNVDPIRYSLVFERFLAPEREDPPDIDLDFPWDERDAVFSAAIQRYGREHVAMVCTHLHYRKWSAMREVARVYGEAREDITDVKRQVSQINKFGGQALLPKGWQSIFHDAERLYGAPRHYGLHPGGLVITQGPVSAIVPTHPSKKIIDNEPLPAIAWEKDGAEDMGLLKIDILGNRSLAVVRDTVQDLAEDGIHIDEQRWHPQDDLATRRVLADGTTMGCFYIESPAMRQLNAKAGSGEFDRLVVHSSIVRPAANRWINDYLKRLHEFNRTGKMNDAWFPHPILKNLLSESFGILSYQEDVMLAAKELAGFTSREQNFLRKSLGRTDTKERLQAVAERFMQGCRDNHIDDAVANLVWSMISSFAGYSFCKAHSASYAMVSFQCAYLKAHHPAYFMAQVISNGGGFYDRSAYVEEARRMGIRIYGPCVLRSAYATRHEQGGQGMRLGLHCVPTLHAAHAHALIAANNEKPFLSFTEVYVRCPMSQREYLAIEQAGAFNNLLKSFNQPQRQWIIKRVHELLPRAKRVAGGLLAYIAEHGYDDPQPPDIKPPQPLDIWRARYQAIGCLPYRHPLCLWPQTQQRRHYYCADITKEKENMRVEVIAWSITGKQVEAVQKKDRYGKVLETPKKSAMSFVTLEDETAVLESTWFSETYRRYGTYLSRRQPLRISGKVQVEFGFVSLVVDKVALI